MMPNAETTAMDPDLSSKELSAAKKYRDDRLALLKINQDRQPSVDSSACPSNVKKTTTLMRRIRGGITDESREAILAEIASLNMSRYSEEAVEAFAGAVLDKLRLADSMAFVAVGTAFHTVFGASGFTQPLAERMRPLVSVIPPSRAKGLTRFVCDAVVVGLLPDRILKTLVSSLRDDVKALSDAFDKTAAGKRLDKSGKGAFATILAGIETASDVWQAAGNVLQCVHLLLRTAGPEAFGIPSAALASTLSPAQAQSSADNGGEIVALRPHFNMPVALATELRTIACEGLLPAIQELLTGSAARLQALRAALGQAVRTRSDTEESLTKDLQACKDVFYTRMLPNAVALAAAMSMCPGQPVNQISAKSLESAFADEPTGDTCATAGKDAGLSSYGEAPTGPTGEALPLFDNSESERLYTDLPNVLDMMPPAVAAFMMLPPSSRAAAAAEACCSDDSGAEAAAAAAAPTLLNRLMRVTPSGCDSWLSEFLSQVCYSTCPKNPHAPVPRDVLKVSSTLRKRLVRAFFSIPSHRFDLIIPCCRVTATLSRVFREFGKELCSLLEQDFEQFVQSATKNTSGAIFENPRQQGAPSERNPQLDTRVKNIRFLGELTKFGVLAADTTIRHFSALLGHFRGYNIHIAGHLVECCGAYLYRHPDTHHRAVTCLDQFVKLREERAGSLDSKLDSFLEAAYNTAVPHLAAPKLLADATSKKTPSTMQFLLWLVENHINSTDYNEVAQIFKDLSWDDPAVLACGMKALRACHTVASTQLCYLAKVVSSLQTKHPQIVAALTNYLVEEIRSAMEISGDSLITTGTGGGEGSGARIIPHQRRIADVRYLGELANVRVLPTSIVIEILYFLLLYCSSGGDPDVPEAAFDRSDDYFRLRLVAMLLEVTLEHALSKSSYSSSLVQWVAFYQRYVFAKRRPLPMDIEVVVGETWDLLCDALVDSRRRNRNISRARLHWPHDADSAAQAVKEVYKQLNSGNTSEKALASLVSRLKDTAMLAASASTTGAQVAPIVWPIDVSVAMSTLPEKDSSDGDSSDDASISGDDRDSDDASCEGDDPRCSLAAIASPGSALHDPFDDDFDTLMAELAGGGAEDERRREVLKQKAGKQRAAGTHFDASEVASKARQVLGLAECSTLSDQNESDSSDDDEEDVDLDLDISSDEGHAPVRRPQLPEKKSVPFVVLTRCKPGGAADGPANVVTVGKRDLRVAVVGIPEDSSVVIDLRKRNAMEKESRVRSPACPSFPYYFPFSILITFQEANKRAVLATEEKRGDVRTR